MTDDEAQRYHLVCRECNDLERIATDRQALREAELAHRQQTGHEVALAPLDGHARADEGGPEMSDAETRPAAHISLQDSRGIDAYLDGERLDMVDGGDMLEFEHREGDGGVTAIYIGVSEVGITFVEGEHWDDADDAYQTDGQRIAFEQREVDDTDRFVFEASEGDRTVGLRTVDSGGEHA